MKLSDKACKNAKPAEKPFKLFDGGGLFLLVNPNGSKLWRLKYRFGGKEKTLALGPYPLVPLIEAREGRERAKKLLVSDPPKDPMMQREDNRRIAIRNAENTFEAVAREWHENQLGRWSADYSRKVMNCLEKNVFPYVGHRPISQITPPELLDCLRKIEKRKALDVAATTKQLCGQVFLYGIQTGKCEWNAAENLKGALRSRKTEHYAAIDAKDLPEFIKAIELNKARIHFRTIRAMRLSMLTFQRPGEIRRAQWSEIDLEEGVWSIAAEKMKMRRAHIVPLSKQAIEILREQKEETSHINTDWVFPNQQSPRKCMSDGTVNKAIDSLGWGNKMTAHGFRALARTTIREKLDYDSEIIEKQLAHKTRNPLGEAYDRTQFLDKRKVMMQDWADYLDAVTHEGKIVLGVFQRRA